MTLSWPVNNSFRNGPETRVEVWLVDKITEHREMERGLGWVGVFSWTTVGKGELFSWNRRRGIGWPGAGLSSMGTTGQLTNNPENYLELIGVEVAKQRGRVARKRSTVLSPVVHLWRPASLSFPICWSVESTASAGYSRSGVVGGRRRA
jgi:hypothetical protein